MKSKGIGVIGCGSRILGLLERIPGLGRTIRVRALCDTEPGAVRRYQDRFGPGAKAYRDYRKLVKDPSVDWVFIGSWNCYHREHAVAALNAGKHVFCEKPLATTLGDCLAMRKAWERKGMKFSVGFTLRYSPHYRKIKQLVDAGKVGKIISMEFNETLHFDHGGFIHGDWRRLSKYSGSHLLEKCCHDMDLAHWIVGSLPARVASFGGTDFFVPKNKRYMKKVGKPARSHSPFCMWPRPEDHNPFTARKDIVDNQVAILEFANWARATFHTNCSTNIGERRMYICGTDGTLRADLGTGTVEVRKIRYGVDVKTFATGARGGHGGGDEVLGRSIRDSILKGAEPLADLDDGLKSAVTCFAVDKAQETGRVVDVGPMWKRAGVTA